jgi:hypothetical protein
MLSDRDIVATVAVKNLEAAKRFYENTLGLPLITENQEALTFKSGRSMLFPRSQAVSAVKRVHHSDLLRNVRSIAASTRSRENSRSSHKNLMMPSTSGSIGSTSNASLTFGCR